MYTVKGFMNIL